MSCGLPSSRRRLIEEKAAVAPSFSPCSSRPYFSLSTSAARFPRLVLLPVLLPSSPIIYNSRGIAVHHFGLHLILGCTSASGDLWPREPLGAIVRVPEGFWSSVAGRFVLTFDAEGDVKVRVGNSLIPRSRGGEERSALISPRERVRAAQRR